MDDGRETLDGRVIKKRENLGGYSERACASRATFWGAPFRDFVPVVSTKA